MACALMTCGGRLCAPYLQPLRSHLYGIPQLSHYCLAYYCAIPCAMQRGLARLHVTRGAVAYYTLASGVLSYYC